MSLGFQNAGFEIVAAFEHWKPAIDVYRENFCHPCYEADLSVSDLPPEIIATRPEVIIGGPPCQDFSSAGPNKPGSARSNLLERFADIVTQVRPRFFVLENVPRSRLKPVFVRAVDRLRLAGYGLSQNVLDAAYYGVPQQRQRLFLVGALDAQDGFLDNLMQNRRAEAPLSIREYLGDELDTDYYFRVPTNYSRRGVFSVDEPSVTIRAIDRPIPSGYPGHPSDPVPIGPEVRTFSVLERSYIQTFPKTFNFSGNKTNLNTMIGNAVPVRLAEHVASALLSFITQEDGDKGV